MARIENLRVRQLDSALEPFRALLRRPPPGDGWVRTIRESLGMSLRQLSERTGLSKTSVSNAELTERRGTIRLETLQKLAEGMGCDLVYALVPRESLQRTMEQQAEHIAERLVGRVSESMELEDQGVPEEETRRQIREMVDELLRDRRRDFWDV